MGSILSRNEPSDKPGTFHYCGFGCVEFGYGPSPVPEAWVHDPVNHTRYTDRPEFYYQATYEGGGEAIVSGNALAIWDCGDVRSDLNQEYVDTYSGGRVYFSSGYLPNCDPWDGGWATGGGTPNFSWSELNGGFQEGNPHPPYGIVRAALTNGLEATRANFGSRPIPLSSGFRCPHGNANVSGVFNSLHVHGRAADMCAAGQPDCGWTFETFTDLKMAAEATIPPPVESLDWNTYPDHHYHAAW